MKKFRFFLLPVLALSMLFAGCQEKEDDIQPDDNSGSKSVGTFKQADLVKAAADMYVAWEENTTIPGDMKVADKTLTQPQYIYAMAKLIVDIKAGSTADIDVLSYKAADHPERDSYDALEIAVYNGPKNGENTEDLGNIATRMIATMADKGQVPNQTLFDRDGNAIAFSTNRATVTFARAISEYSAAGAMPEKVSTDYLSTSATLKGFASQFVTYLDVWEENVAEKLSADGSHCSDNNTAWEYVHFVPIPASGGYADGVDQYDPKFQPYHTIEVAGVVYDAAQCWGIALKGILDLVTKEGSAVSEVERNPATPAHTAGNGKGLNAPIPTVEDYFIWGKYPWYEKADDPCAVQYNGQPLEEVDVDFLIRLIPWHLTRSSQLAAIGNFQTFGDDPASNLYYEGYKGNISPMREFLIAARFYKYLLDNNITENVYDAMKGVKISADLYGSEQAPITVSAESAAFEYGGGDQKVIVTTKDEAWTATVEGDFIAVSPASGNAGATEVTITALPNEGGSRSATVTFSTASGVAKSVAVTQSPAPTSATIREFAQEYVKLIGIWNNTVGTVNYLTGIGANNDEHDVPNAHYIPAETTITLSGVEYGTSAILELAERSYLLLRGIDGASTEVKDIANFSSVTAATMDSSIPETHSWTWGTSPFNETGSTVPGSVSGNGGGFRMGNMDAADGVELIKTDGLDNFAKRHIVYANKNAGKISNMCGYAGGQLAGYYGCFSAQRALLTYAYFFQYMLDNSLSDATAISEDQTFNTYLFGDASVETPTLKGWAAEFVKCLDVWASTTGTVDADGDHNQSKGTAHENAHFIPIAEPSGNSLGNEGNQYDAKWADSIWDFEYAGTTYSSNQAWEVAIRGLLNMVTSEGEEGLALMDDRNKAWTFANNASFVAAAVPASSDNNKWGAHPWYELSGPATYNGEAINEVGLDFIVKACSWHVVRGLIKTAGNGSPLNAIGNFQEFGTSSSTLNLEGYAGLICPMRELLIVARVYDYLLENNVDSNVYDAIKDQKFDYTLY